MINELGVNLLTLPPGKKLATEDTEDTEFFYFFSVLSVTSVAKKIRR